jgi:hypothetical protein
MCDPVSLGTLTLVAAGVSAVGQGVSAYSSYQQAGFEARVAGQNARIETERSRDALERGRVEKLAYQRRLGQEKGKQFASLAANGIDPTFGSAADVRGDTAMFGAEDVRTIDANAMREAQGFEINALNFRSEALAARRRKTGALVKGALDIGSTALSGAQQYKRISFGRTGG